MSSRDFIIVRSWISYRWKNCLSECDSWSSTEGNDRIGFLLRSLEQSFRGSSSRGLPVSPSVLVLPSGPGDWKTTNGHE
jgi:hypothetical protein